MIATSLYFIVLPNVATRRGHPLLLVRPDDERSWETSDPHLSFTSLITAISAIKHFQAGYKGNVPFYALDKFKAWRQYFLAHFPAPLPHTTRIIFCLLFPELDTYRKYHLKEAKLAQAVAQVISSSHTCLNDWKASGSSGCLGREITKALEQKSTASIFLISCSHLPCSHLL